MKNRAIKQIFILFFLLVGNILIVTAGFVESPGNISPSEKAITFEGIWVGPGNVTLIKQLDGYVIFQGKDNISTWWARGVIDGNKITCRGSGVTSIGIPFVYESDITLEGDILKDEWKAIFSGGKELQGNDKLKRIEINLPERTEVGP